MKLPRHNKKGITLVEVIVGVFVLSIFAVGILSLLIYNNQAVSNSTREKAATSTAAQKLDTVISAVSNGPESGFLTLDSDNNVTGLDLDALCTLVDLTAGSITVDSVDKYDASNIRGWYITLKYSDEVSVKGYVANTQGAFDK